MALIPRTPNQEELFRRAKIGDDEAIEELRRQNIKVWTLEELKALNLFIENRVSTLNQEPTKVPWAPYLRRQFNSRLELALVVWCKYIYKGYHLCLVRYEDETQQHWVAITDRYPEPKFLCCVDQWIKEESNEKGRRSKSSYHLERQTKRWSRSLRDVRTIIHKE